LHLAAAKALRIEGGTDANDQASYFSFGGNGTFGIDAPGVANGRLVVNNSGNVGIGTASPNAKLHLAGGNWDLSATEGDLKIGNDAMRIKLGIALGGGGAGDGRIRAVGGTNRLMIGSGTVDTLTVAGGNVGIGTVYPDAQLHLAGGNWDLTNTEGDLKIGNDAMRIKLGIALGGGGAGDGRIRAMGGTNRLFIGSGTDDTLTVTGGCVGIANITPTEKLSVNGNVLVTGDILLPGADCAEQFDVMGSEPPGPGTVVVIDEGGALRECSEAYDKKVAGVVSGAGEYRHALVLDKRPSDEGRIPIALVGKAYCKVDAEYSPIDVGDLLTTSLTPGHAMKAAETKRAFGSIIGKALRPLERGQGLIPILISLQ
jgi:hypothetical protein